MKFLCMNYFKMNYSSDNIANSIFNIYTLYYFIQSYYTINVFYILKKLFMKESVQIF